MLLFFVFVLIAILWTRLESTRGRLTETREWIRQWVGDRDKIAELAVGVHQLRGRVEALEKSWMAGPGVSAEETKEESGSASAEELRQAIENPVLAEDTVLGHSPLPNPEAIAEVKEPPPLPPPISSPLPPPLPPPQGAPPVTATQENLREDLQARNWEALIGGNLLNKLGALVLVIGIALFLSYSFTRMGPAGRALTGLATSLAILAGGVWVERKAEYRIFARGLIAAGWASLYFTSYAMYALDATRVIENPFVGLILMLSVATGMIWHSLRYQAQALTGLAYGCAFGALALTGLTTYAVVALIPLAASLLYLARRFRWHEMALFGALATYATFLARPDTGAPLITAEGMLLVFWMMFEAFDLWRVALRQTALPVHHLLFAVNACAGLGASAAIWFRKSPETMWQFCAAGATLYLASAAIRILVDENSLYEASLAISALLTGLAIFARVPGIWTSLALLVEAEILFLAGFYLRIRLARLCSLAAFSWSLLLLMIRPGTADVLGIPLDVWAVPLALHALVFYGNRFLDRGARYFGYTAAAAIATIVGFEAPRRYAGGVCLLFGGLLFEMGQRKRLSDFRYQGYALGALGAAGVCLSYLDPQYVWRSWVHAAAAGVALASAIRAERSLKHLPEIERQAMRMAGSWGATALASMFFLRTAPDAHWGIAFLAASTLLLELALRRMPGELWIPAILLNACGFATLLLGHALDIHKTQAPEVWVDFAGGAVAYFWLAARTLASKPAGHAALRRFSLAGGSVLAALTLWMVLPDVYVPVALGTLALLSVELGILFSSTDLVTQGRLLSLVPVAVLAWMTLDGDTAGRLPNGLFLSALHAYTWWRLRQDETVFLHGWMAAGLAAAVARMEYPDYTLAVWSLLGLLLACTGKWLGVAQLRLQSAALALIAFGFGVAGDGAMWQRAALVAWFLIAMTIEERDKERQVLRRGYGLLAALLTTITLFRDVSGGVLTLSWGLEGIGLLGLGFALRERMLRLSGLALLLTCILKLFVYDLRNLETLFRILSFIGLGVILLGVSWIYTRFKDEIQKYF